MLIDIGATKLNVERRGDGPLPLIVLHGGPGLDHTVFGHWLDPLGDVARLLLVDQRAQGRSEPAPPETWTLAQQARDVEALAAAMGLDRYAVLGHSYGAFVALQHAVDFPGRPAGTIVSAGVPAARYLEAVEQHLATFEPEELRAQVASSWEREATVQTQEECRALWLDQLPFHFRDPRDPRIAQVQEAMADAVYAPEVVRAAAQGAYGGIDVEDRLGDVTHPLLALAGRYDRACGVEAHEAIAAGVPGAELVVLEHSGHMTYVEEPERYLAAVRAFLARL
ncbi:MAG TPA: alpha/beta fold hydrolase [Solirubrobacteraceae bacterium]|nr:alpha/beta fold hydrolase [Solirubrobacteraceae bacterium]